MRKLGIAIVGGGFAIATLLYAPIQDAAAIAPFKNEFFDLYVKEDPKTAEEKAFAEAAGASTGKCYVCHVNMSKRGEKGLGKKVRNSYGKALSQFLKKANFSSERREMEPDKVKAEIQAAIKKVSDMKSDPKDAKSPTFGELIKNGKLPGNDVPDPADVKKAIAARDAAAAAGN